MNNGEDYRELPLATRENLEREGATVILLVPVTANPEQAGPVVEMRLPLSVLREWLKAED